MILTGMLNVVLRRVLYEHGRRGVRLRAPDEYGVVCEQAPGRQGPGLDAPGPHLGQGPRQLPRSELHRLPASLWIFKVGLHKAGIEG